MSPLPQGLTPEIAMALLNPDASPVRDRARTFYLESLPVEDLIDWCGRAAYAAAVRHPKGATILPGHVAEVIATAKAGRQAATS